MAAPSRESLMHARLRASSGRLTATGRGHATAGKGSHREPCRHDRLPVSRRRLSRRGCGDRHRPPRAGGRRARPHASSTPPRAASPATPAGSIPPAAAAVASPARVHPGRRPRPHPAPRCPPGAPLPVPGETVDLAPRLGPRGYRLMRMHTRACTCSRSSCPTASPAAPSARTRAGSTSTCPSRPTTSPALEAALNAYVAAGLPVTAEWITEAELAARPEMVKTMKVKPPRRPGPGAAGPHRRRRRDHRPAALRRHPRRSTAEIGAAPHRQDREEGPREPPGQPALRRLTGAGAMRDGPMALYRRRVAEGALDADPAQRLAVEKLQLLAMRLADYNPAKPKRVGTRLLRLGPRPARGEGRPRPLPLRRGRPRQVDADGPVLRDRPGHPEAPRPFPRLHAGGPRAASPPPAPEGVERPGPPGRRRRRRRRDAALLRRDADHRHHRRHAGRPPVRAAVRARRRRRHHLEPRPGRALQGRAEPQRCSCRSSP